MIRFLIWLDPGSHYTDIILTEIKVVERYRNKTSNDTEIKKLNSLKSLIKAKAFHTEENILRKAKLK